MFAGPLAQPYRGHRSRKSRSGLPPAGWRPGRVNAERRGAVPARFWPMAPRRPKRPSAGMGALATGLSVAAALTLGASGCGGGSPDPASRADRVASLRVSDLHRCKSGPTPRRLRCGEIQVPLERREESLGKTRIGFVILPRRDRDQPAARVDRRGRGRTGIRELMDGPLLREAVRGPAGAPRPGDGRHARHRPLQAARLPRPPVRTGAGLDRPAGLRRAARAALQLVPDLGGGGRHQRRAQRPRARTDHAVRRFLRHIPGPVVRFPSSADAECPGARLGLSGPGRERLVSEPDLDRRAIPGDRLPALAGLLRQRAEAPAQARRLAAIEAPRGGSTGRRAGCGRQLASGLLPADRPRGDRARAAAMRPRGRF